ncbi:MAG: hypothetical protein DRP96_00380 [Candidatus Neomarinimicrobiota bacterium]|nr:MAG: hypothetical protein DRP96_00380 [Candidatus Neomarinimicrobiota bacterium]
MARRVLTCFLILAIPFFVFAANTGKIAGICTDKESGKPLMGVNIVVKGTMYGAASGSDGRFFIFNVPPGIYDVEASYIGYAKMIIEGVRITTDMTTDVNFPLSSETIQGEEVVVVAERPLIEAKSTNERRVIRSEDLENLPVKDVQDIAALQTGAVKVGNQLHIRGGRVEEVAYYVDGVYQVNDYSRQARAQAGEVSSSAIEEMNYQAGGFDAEYGNATSGLINLSTKIGGDRWAFGGEAVTDEFLSESEAFLNTYSYGYNLYNFSAGGPITDKIRVYGSLEHKFERDRRTSSAPHPEGTYIGDLDGDGIKDYDEYEVKSVYGPLPYNQSSTWSGVGNVFLNLHPFRVKIGGNFTKEKYREYNHDFAAFNPENNPLWKASTYAAYSRLTWTISNKSLINAQISYFMDKYATGHPKYWDDFLKYGTKECPAYQYAEIYQGADPIYDPANMTAAQLEAYNKALADTSKYDWYEKDGYVWLITQPYLYGNGYNGPRTSDAYAGFYPNGTISIHNDYLKNETSYLGGNVDFKTQQGNHEIRIGGEYRGYTVRYYRLGAPERLASTYISNNPPLTETDFSALSANSTLRLGSDTYEDYIDNYWKLAFKNAYGENMGYTYDGSEYINDKLEDNPDGPRRPKIGGIYIQDKLELKDLILNLGLRYDYISPGNMKFRDNTQIVLDSLGQISDMVYKNEDGVYDSYAPTPFDNEGRKQLVRAPDYNIVSPRLGLAFPVTDRTVFHAQYGRYVQQVQLNRLFISYLRFASNLQQGNYTISGNPALEPVKTTSYELGFKQQLGMNSSIDVTMYYKQLTGYVQIRNVTGARPVVYATYVNGDYGTIKGLSFSFNLRRTRYIQAMVNYTLQYANGTGSTATGQYKISWQSGNYPTFTSPLDFDQRHTGSIILDFRTTEKDRLKRIGANAVFSFGSGRRYTPTEINSAVFPKTADSPIAALNSGVMPFIYQLDLKFDKTAKFGNVDVNFYLWIQNALNTKNVRDVYDGTGLPDEDGWFSTPDGQQWANTSTNRVDLYKMFLKTPFNYETPRIIRLGVKFDI